ncbi:glycosyltransferase [Clostridium botulinum]|uniref:glycosyltransferase family 2 protein n=1 Tax=Clostridium botulinum TaxID=1491 RepID=UPI00140020A9|nr:glycosyltransferase [Clostridium botulinum]MBY6839004.1 glycosyltransferase [Clostridium botulinum]NFG65042.1 glycosyltransferase [Clostridium botulinum]NFQ25035.1 glycosyltransferase [Clostridium botulinum]
MKVSVIIPVYNCEQYLDKCIQSLLNQTLEEIEFIFVNDGSTDKSRKILEEYKKKDNRIIIINQKNSGVSSARNVGLKYCNGQYIGFVDSDDFIEKKMYESMYNKAVQEECDLVICDYIKYIIKKKKYKLEYKQFIEHKSEKLNVTKFALKQFLIKQENGYSWNKIYKREIIEKNNLNFNQEITMCEDLLFNLNFLQYINKIGYINEYYYSYLMRSDSAIHIFNETSFYARKIIYEKTKKNSRIWGMNQQYIVNKINEFNSYKIYECLKNQFTNKKISYNKRKQKARNIINDPYTRIIRNEILNNDIDIPLKCKIFYKICDTNILIYIYMNMLNLISNIKSYFLQNIVE